MTDEADKKKHQDMHDEKDREEESEEKMKRARRLVSANCGRQERKHRGYAKRHPETGQNDRRKQNEYNSQIGQSLRDIVTGRVVRVRMLPADVSRDHALDSVPTEVGFLRQEIVADVPRGEAADDVSEAGDDQHPGKEEMVGAVPNRRAQDKGNWQIDKRGGSEGAGLAPIEARMGYQNADAAHQETKDAERDQPVSDANPRAMTGRVRH